MPIPTRDQVEKEKKLSLEPLSGSLLNSTRKATDSQCHQMKTVFRHLNIIKVSCAINVIN